MSPALLVSLVVAFLVGTGSLLAVWPEGVSRRSYRYTIAALGVGVGLGVTSLLFFAWLLLGGSMGPGVVGVELGYLAGLGLWIRHRARHLAQPSRTGTTSAPAEPGWVVVLCALTVCLACAAFVGISAARPHGAWDAWMNWNLRARLIYRSGAEWPTAFSPLIPWSHPDYPVLVPASVVRAWIYHGGEAIAGPALIAFAFTFGTAALAGAAVGALRDRAQGMLTATILLTTPFFVFHGTAQYADVPVGFFFLATLVFFTLHERHRDRTFAFFSLAGLTAGLAAWTKNEGLLFLVAFSLAWAISGVLDRSPRELAREAGYFALGLLLPGLMLALFKFELAPPNDLVTAAGTGSTLNWLEEPRRYWQVAQGFLVHIAAFGFNGWISGVALLVLYGLLAGLRPELVGRRWSIVMLGSLALTLAGHAVVLLTAVEDVPRMLGSSLDRLLLQLWPAAVFSAFMILATPAEAAQRRSQKGAAAKA